MLGAIAGDIIGSRFERHNTTNPTFRFFTEHSTFTDDSVLTCAIADALFSVTTYTEKLCEFACAYPNHGYGDRFLHWVRTGRSAASRGNGAAMRVSPIAWFFDTMDEVLDEAEKSAKVTHDTEEAIEGAKAIAAAVFMGRKFKPRILIREFIEKELGYKFSPPTKALHRYYKSGSLAKDTVPIALQCFFEGWGFEQTIRKAVLVGGDSDTIASMAGAIAHAYYGDCGFFNPDEIYSRLDDRMLHLVGRMEILHKEKVEALPNGIITYQLGRNFQYQWDCELFGVAQDKYGTPGVVYGHQKEDGSIVIYDGHRLKRKK